MAQTPEGRVKAKVDKLFKELGVWYYSPQAGPYGASGIPDRVAIANGLFIGVECKADKTKKPTALQMKCMADIEHAGGKCFVVCDDESLSLLREFLYARCGKGQGPSTQAQ